MAKIGFDPICYGTAVTAQWQVATATVQRNFSCRQRNSYGTCVTGTAEQQRNGGNQAFDA